MTSVPAFRADNVGSFLRPSYLLEARRASLDEAELRRIEDRAIADVLALQENVGLSVVTDGEFRRRLFFSNVVAVADGFDPVGFERFHRDETGQEERFGVPTPIAKLSRKASLVDVELAFVKQHTHRPIKVTMPSPSLLLSYWTDGVSDRAYPDKQAFLDDLIGIMNEDARALAAAGAAYLQIDAPLYTYVTDPVAAKAARTDARDPAGELRRMLAADNRVFEGVSRTASASPSGVTTGLHLCRGNYKSKFTGTRPYSEFVETIFEEARFDRLLMEYDDARAGGFEPLADAPKAMTIVLGLVTTKTPELEDRDELLRRIDEATRHVPLDRLALSTQCGFASVDEGNKISPEAQKAKLELVAQTAREVWGEA
jgi:5-methyltetrahydropteroyltriglutamate--homocysteine methyltransferase